MNAWVFQFVLLTLGGPRTAVVPPVVRPGMAKIATVRANANFSLTITPATISFTGTNPTSAPVVAGSAAASVTWSNSNPSAGNWNLTVLSSSPTFTNCPSIPLSAVTVSCTSSAVTPNGSATCSAPFALSTSAQQVVGGHQSAATSNYAVNLTFTLADSWKYIAETNPSCSLSLSYLATVP